jgi:hypothetical protein
MHVLNTTPDNEIANTLLDEAFRAPEDMRLYRIGIAAHAFADTWAHQNFIGWHDFFNNIGLDFKFNIGHADAEYHPDMVAHRWEDSRLREQCVCNNIRFFDAAGRLYEKFRYFTTNVLQRSVPNSWNELFAFFSKATNPSCSGPFNHNRTSRNIMYQAQAPWLGEYDEREWLNEAIVTKVHGLPDEKPGALFTMFDDESFWREDVSMEDTHWFRFQESIKVHQKRAIELIQPKFDVMGIKLRDN